jgi:hypothetical protein
MYTCHSYETGVLWDDSGHIRPEHFEESTPVGLRTKIRIDNVNGLLRLKRVGKKATKAQCLEILDSLHSVLMSNTENSQVLKQVASILGVDQERIHSIQYGIKSSAGVSSSDKTKVYGTNDDAEASLNKEGTEKASWTIFDKHRDEKLEHSQPTIVDGDTISRKAVVAVFRDSKGKKVFELSLGTLNSPLTIGQHVDEDGVYIYPEIGKLLEQLTPDSTSKEVFEVCSTALEICER